MPLLALLRHGPTAWTAACRLQGRADIELSESGRQTVRSWRLPRHVVARTWMTSPLKRCTETAAILQDRHSQAPAPRADPTLIEMSYGEWEGESLAALRAANGAAVAERENLGLDFRAPGGESPREVLDRLRPWLAQRANESENVLAITHKGVIRALYALATGWDMREKPRHRLADEAIHEFRIDRTGFHLVAVNLDLKSDSEHAVHFR
jgi:probable phosphoglycerate mutase